MSVSILEPLPTYNKDMPKDGEKNVRVRIPDDLHAMVVELAKRERRSLNAQILACLERCAAPPRTASGASLTAEERAGYNAGAGGDTGEGGSAGG